MLPMAKLKKKSDLPEIVAREFYIHRAVGRGLAGVFFHEHEEKRGAAAGGHIAFRFADVVYFFAVAAANGVIGNLTYNALAALAQAVRKPKEELTGANVKFEAVVSRNTYNRLKRQKNGGNTAAKELSTAEKKLTKEYSLMVTLKSSLRDDARIPKKRR